MTASRSVTTLDQNVLNGGAGADRMFGGVGNDTYYVDNASDRVIENLNEGYDTVRTTISLVAAANVERVILDGVANISRRTAP